MAGRLSSLPADTRIPPPAAPELGAPGCPKRMEHGPCGGVEADGRCEVAVHACSFLELAPVHWRADAADAVRSPVAAGTRPAPMAAAATGVVEPPEASVRMRERVRKGSVVIADFPARALDVASLEACARALVGTVDAVLAGDSGSARVQFPPAYRAHLLREHGLDAWMGVNARDRNRVALEAEGAALAHAQAAGVHCVTGDHTLIGSRADAAPVFDLDSTQITAMMAARGHLVSVAEAPLSPPTHARPARLLQKQRAGAEVCFVNHAGGAEPVRDFVERAQALGVTLGFIPCVPVIVDSASAESIRGFTSLVLPPGYLDGILASRDVAAAGIAAAVRLATEMMEIPGVVGVNLSGGPGPGRELDFARAQAAIGTAVTAAKFP